MIKLCALSNNGEWPVEQWDKMLINLNRKQNNDELLKNSWYQIAPVIEKAPKSKIEEISHSLSIWMEKQSKIFERHENMFFSIIDNVLNLDHVDDEFDLFQNDLFCNAINHPVGHITQALLNYWYRKNPKGTESLHKKIKSRFIKLCDRKEIKFRHGRVLLAAHVINLFRIDKNWTRKHFLHFFNWQSSEDEARATWQGFSWRQLLYRPLLSVIKKDFLETTQHYDKLSEHAEAFANLLVLASLDREDTFTIEELMDATSSLSSSKEGLEHSLWALFHTLEGAGDQRKEYWNNRVLPYLEKIWPQSKEVLTPRISMCMSILCIETGEAFPEAVKKLCNWLQRADNLNEILLDSSLQKNNFCTKFPESSLKFLDAVVSDGLKPWLLLYLKKCLNDIETSEKSLSRDPRFIRLRNISNK